MLKKNDKLVLFFLLLHQLIIAQTSPLAIIDYDTADVNTTLTVAAPGVLANDSDSNGDKITVSRFYVDGRSVSAGKTESFSGGTITINEDGGYVFIPSGAANSFVDINYDITDGTFTSSSALLLTVEKTKDLLEISDFTSCNQGYTADKEYKIQYSFTLKNTSTARDYHAPSLIKSIKLINDLQATFGNGCIISVDEASAFTSIPDDFVNTPYPDLFNTDAINPNFLNGSSDNFFTTNAENNFILYPRQSIFISFCVRIDAFCNGRTDPTPASSGLDFDSVLVATSNMGTTTNNLELTNFHSTEAVLTAGLLVPNTNPAVNSDGTFEYTNTVIIKNGGTTAATNVNYNMGLGSFFDNGISFSESSVTQISGPTVVVNTTYNGDTNAEILASNNSLPPGGTIVLEVFFKTDPTASGYNSYFQMNESQTQGALDGFDDTTPTNKKYYSFVLWSDSSGNHLDRYYPLGALTDDLSIINKCSCGASFIELGFTSSSSITTTTKIINEAPNGILEHQEIAFNFTATNTSGEVELKNLQLIYNLNNVCNDGIVSFTAASIAPSSTATTNPILNTNYNATGNGNFFDGSSGLLKANESITIQFSVVFNEDCISIDNNESSFSGNDPVNSLAESFRFVNISVSSDTDGDGISNVNDLDDDNDTIPDINEYNVSNPLADQDNDLTPNYRDLDFGDDINNDGIIDIFDFDNDGVPNHFDLDSDNDGILDIVEAGNAAKDTNNNGRTNNVVGDNGLDNDLENSDSDFTSINYTIPNTDNNGNFNFIDIDADGDGIVDNIEGQLTSTYIAPNNTVNLFGIDTAYPKGISPIDTEDDTIFDYIDTNSDNDIRDDIVEAWDVTNDGIAETVASNLDADNDGLDDAFDIDNSLINPSNSQVSEDFPNLENISNPERDWREIIAIAVLINNVTATEGGNLEFTITLVKNSNQTELTESASDIEIAFTLVNGTSTTTEFNEAIAPFDYSPLLNANLTILPNTNTIEVLVTSLEDLIYEQEEFFTINGVITPGNTVNTSIQGIGTILDNDPKPSITMTDSMEEEGTALLHTITLSNPSSTPVEVMIQTSDDLAIDGKDYTEFSQNITIDGTTDPSSANISFEFEIQTLNDNLNELDEEVLNVIGTVTSTNTLISNLEKTGTILDTDPYPVISVNNLTAEEGSPFDFAITLLNADLLPMQNYLPIAIKLETDNVTANSPADYLQVTSTLAIPALTSSISQTIITNNDALNEDTETISLRATIIDSNAANISSSEGIGTIKDNDYPNLFSPNSDGKSDVFKISGIEDFTNFKLIIVDRWGNKIYNYSNNGSNTPIWWDGTNNGTPVPEGVYYYTLDFNDGTTKPRTNFIQLVR